MRVHIQPLSDKDGFAALLLYNGPDPVQNVAWRSQFHYDTREQAYVAAVAVARIEFEVPHNELGS